MSLSHFDERSGIVSCETPWGKWWQTIMEVFIEVKVPDGTRGKECKIVIKPSSIECKVKNEVVFKGDLYRNVVSDDSTWTLEEQNKISILLAKSQKFTRDNPWESLLSDEYAPDAHTMDQMLKKLELEKYEMDNGSGDEESSPKKKHDDAASSASGSDNEVEESNEHVADHSSGISPPASPAGSVESERSEDEVHISEAEGSNHGSDVETGHNDRDSGESDAGEGSDNEMEIDEKHEEGQESDQEGSVPEINIQSEDEDNDKAESDAERAQSDDEKVNSDMEKGESDDEEEMHSKRKNVESEDEEEMQSKNKRDDESDGEKSGRGSPVAGDAISSPKASQRVVDSDDEQVAVKSKKNEQKGDSDAEGGEYGELIANIFGDSEDEEGSPSKGRKVVRKKKQQASKNRKVISDSEDENSDAEEVAEADRGHEHEEEEGGEKQDLEEEEGKEDNEKVAPEEDSKAVSKSSLQVSDDDSDEGIGKSQADFISDFDLMMQKKKEESSKRRKRKDVDIINDSDDLIADIISQMRQAADEDRQLNKLKRTATKKLKILPLVMSQLKKHDLKMAFLDQGVLNVMADWLAPLPDRSLPNLQIREGMIRRLGEFPFIDQSLLKSSGVGRALMYLYKHPKETKENRERAGRLITEWARPIFNVTTDYHSLTKEEREQRDFDHVPKKRKRDADADQEDMVENKDIDKAMAEGNRQLRPGDKGWIGRARVPMPSTKDYVVRPKWKVEMECGRGPSRKPLNRFEKHMRTQMEKKRNAKAQRAVTISIEGRKMAI